ncbi:response regulator [Jejuia spongiicola]|uniref:Response regulator n=1 Tax=Jejuia spongiicola TaxID=2942207 RepID=A0ABT0QD40_9FLAO|nr:response regulator [Jejuia spongiicola]MCL6294846.1 response regulator [Jejuia spongiicola]
MNKIINVLIAEDEPLIIGLLKKIFMQLSDSNGDWKFKLHPTQNCDDALKKIDNAIIETPFDLALLDINLPPSKQNNVLCGEDLGIELRKYFPQVKIIIYTANNDNYRLNNILRSVNPDGFLIKSDIDYKGLMMAIHRVLTNPPYYSPSILNLIRQHITSDFVLDATDRVLLHELSKGTRTKDLPNFVNLSKGGVERRKRHLKEVFNIEGKGDKKLIQIAKDRGYV